MDIEIAVIRAVLLADGWHAIVEGSFDLGAYCFYQHGELVAHRDDTTARVRAIASAGFSFLDQETGLAVSGPVSSILAVREIPA